MALSWTVVWRTSEKGDKKRIYTSLDINSRERDDKVNMKNKLHIFNVKYQEKCQRSGYYITQTGYCF